MHKDIQTILRERNAILDYESANDAPIIFNNSPIGIVKNYNTSGFVECILWDKFLDIEISFDGDRHAVINALNIGNKYNNKGELK